MKDVNTVLNTCYFWMPNNLSKAFIYLSDDKDSRPTSAVIVKKKLLMISFSRSPTLFFGKML